MARNGSGTYNLPAAVNPVVSGTVVSSNWANTTLQDIAGEITNSLAVDGQGAMNGQLKLIAGTLTSPGVAFSSEPNTGFSKPSSGTLQLGVQGNSVMTFTPTTVSFNALGARIQADFSNGTLLNRVAFQTTAPNTNTRLSVIPNGTVAGAGPRSTIDLFGSQDPSNTSTLSLQLTDTDARIVSGLSGTGSFLPLTFYTSATERARFTAGGNHLIGTTTDNGSLLQVNGTASFNGAVSVTGTITAPTFSGALSGNATTVTSVTSGQVTTALGYTPVQQGTGVGQLTNVVKLGWSGSYLKATVDSTDLGNVATQGWVGTQGYLTSVTPTQITTALGYTPVNKAGDTLIGVLNVANTTGVIAQSAGSLGKLNVQSAGTDAAYMQFLRTGQYGAYFGIDTDNQWKVGGWSRGAAADTLIHTGNQSLISIAATQVAAGVTGRVNTSGITYGSYGSVSVTGSTNGYAGVVLNSVGGVLMDNGTTHGYYRSNSSWLWNCDNSGNLSATGNVTANSDERKKTNWRDLPADFVEQLAEVKSGIYDRTDLTLTQVGVSAQSLQKPMPDAVIEGEDGFLSVAYGQAALASCVEMAKVIVQLKARIAMLEAA